MALIWHSGNPRLWTCVLDWTGFNSSARCHHKKDQLGLVCFGLKMNAIFVCAHFCLFWSNLGFLSPKHNPESSVFKMLIDLGAFIFSIPILFLTSILT